MIDFGQLHYLHGMSKILPKLKTKFLRLKLNLQGNPPTFKHFSNL